MKKIDNERHQQLQEGIRMVLFDIEMNGLENAKKQVYNSKLEKYLKNLLWEKAMEKYLCD